MLTQLSIDPAAITDPLATHIAASAVVLALPGALLWGADAVAQRLVNASTPQTPLLRQVDSVGFVELAYGWLPWVWAATLAFYIESFMGEAGRVVQVAAATFGADGSHLPRLVVVPPVIAFVQFVLLLGGLGVGGVTTWHLGKQLSARCEETITKTIRCCCCCTNHV